MLIRYGSAYGGMKIECPASERFAIGAKIQDKNRSTQFITQNSEHFPCVTALGCSSPPSGLFELLRESNN